MRLAAHDVIIWGGSGRYLQQRENKVLTRIIDPVRCDQFRQLVIPTVSSSNVARPARPNTFFAIRRAYILSTVRPVANQINALNTGKRSLPIMPFVFENSLQCAKAMLDVAISAEGLP